MFAKLYESDKFGQILVQKCMDEDGFPCVKFTAEPEGFGTCSITSGYEDDDKGLVLQEETFKKCDIDLAEKAAACIFDAVNGGK